MPCLLYSPDSSNRSFHSRLSGVPHVGTGEKKVVGWQTSSRALPPHNLFPPIAPPSSTTLQPSVQSLMQLSCSDKKRCPRAFPMSGPTAVNRPRHGKGTRDYSRLTEVNPYSAPVIRGHMCLVCQKSRFSSCSPFASGEQSEKTITDTPWLFAVFMAPVVLAPRKTDTPWLHDQPQAKKRRYAMNISASANNAYRRG